MKQITELSQEIKLEQEKENSRQKILNKKMSKQVKTLEDELRNVSQFKGNCPSCGKPCIVFGSHDYDWELRDASNGYSDCVLSGKDIMYHDSCFFNEFGHLD